MAQQRKFRLGNGKKWLAWIDFELGAPERFNIDVYIIPNQDFWQGLEVYCAAPCCGIDAFSFQEEEIKSAAKWANTASLQENLAALLSALASTQIVVVESSFLCQRLHKDFAFALFQHVLQTIESDPTP